MNRGASVEFENLKFENVKFIVMDVLTHASRELGGQEATTKLYETLTDYLICNYGLDRKTADNFGRPIGWYLAANFFEPPRTAIGKDSLYVRKGNGALKSISSSCPAILGIETCAVMDEYGATLAGRLH